MSPETAHAFARAIEAAAFMLGYIIVAVTVISISVTFIAVKMGWVGK